MGQLGFSTTKFILILVLALLIAGIGVGVYLINQKQTFRSKASQDWIDAFTITDLSEQKTLVCDKGVNPPVCTTKSLEFKVKVRDLSLLSNVLGEDVVAEIATGSAQTATATPSATPAIPTSKGKVTSIQFNGVELDLEGKSPATIRLTQENKGASFDVPVIIVSVDNRTNYFTIKFNYTASNLEATGSATPKKTPAPTPIKSEPAGKPTSRPVSSSSPIPTLSKTDINGDGKVNSVDVSEFLTLWKGVGSASSKLLKLDLNGDKLVNIFDYVTLKKAITP